MHVAHVYIDLVISLFRVLPKLLKYNSHAINLLIKKDETLRA